MLIEAKVLTLTSYGDKEGETYRVTLNVCNIDLVEADEILSQKQGMNLYKVLVAFSGGGSGELYVTREDLTTLERAVGFYDYSDEL